jgi:hypothetical protein
MSYGISESQLLSPQDGAWILIFTGLVPPSMKLDLANVDRPQSTTKSHPREELLISLVF